MDDKHDLFKYVTPILVTITLFMVGMLNSAIKDIDSKLFAHLTNDEIHVPRGMIVTKGEYELYCKFYEQERKEIKEFVSDVIDEVRDGNKAMREMWEKTKQK